MAEATIGLFKHQRRWIAAMSGLAACAISIGWMAISFLDRVALLYDDNASRLIVNALGDSIIQGCNGHGGGHWI